MTEVSGRKRGWRTPGLLPVVLAGAAGCGTDAAPLTSPSAADAPGDAAVMGAPDGDLPNARPDGGMLDGGQDIPERCRVPGETGICQAAFPRYTYVAERGRCEFVVWGGCGDTSNLFESVTDCATACMPAPARCADQDTPRIASWVSDACSPRGGQESDCRRETLVATETESAAACRTVTVTTTGRAGDVAARYRAELTPLADALLLQAAREVQAAFPEEERYQEPGSSVGFALTLIDERGEVVHSYSTPPLDLLLVDRLMFELTLAVLACDPDSPLLAGTPDCET